MDIKQLQTIILDLAKEKGWGTKPEEIIFAEKIALIHSELSEALEAYRKGQMDGRHGVAEELADVLMRTLQLAGIYNIDLEKELLKKIDIDKNRDWDNDQLYIDRDNRSKLTN